jgi:hypothetical protein
MENEKVKWVDLANDLCLLLAAVLKRYNLTNGDKKTIEYIKERIRNMALLIDESNVDMKKWSKMVKEIREGK